MRIKYFICLLLNMVFASSIFAQKGIQKDTLYGVGEEVVVTATRSERKLSNVAVPTTIISQKNIQRAGSLRLTDILQEQAGLFLTSGFGTGVQMQGLNPDYTLIMVNGEPLVGRTSGVLDLNRLTVGNVKKIEIVKGPSSSLYGSEALAGVINIITDKPLTNQFNASARYGTYNTTDLNIGGTVRSNKFSYTGFGNAYHTDGFSIRPFSTERTVAPLWRLTTQHQLNIPLGEKTNMTISGRYNYEHIKNIIAVGNTGNIIYSEGRELNKDINGNIQLNHHFTNKLKSSLRVYATQFESSQDLVSTGGSPYTDYLNHRFIRFENQTDYTVNDHLSFVGGAGYINEGVKSTRYDNSSNRKTNNIGYGFVQSEWKPLKQLTLITGTRFDYNQLFASAFSPKLAAMYRVNEKLRFTASIGRGFKAPDFRQLYLNFTNTAAGSYSVFGTIEAQKVIAELDKQGLIQSYESDFYRLKDLKPEFSTGINIGTQWKPIKQVTLNINLFRNDIENLIDSRLVAYYKTGAQIFSYLNVKNAFTQGFEADIAVQINQQLSFTSGYQLLYTADKSQLAEIKAGKVFTKDENGFSRIMNRNEYFGLPNRSRHMANFKILYEHKNFFANIRALYRSKWAVADTDGNGLYNTNDEFANGYVQLNVAAGYQFKKGIRVQIGTDNLGNYTDINNLPNLPGRTFYCLIAYSFSKNTNKK